MSSRRGFLKNLLKASAVAVVAPSVLANMSFTPVAKASMAEILTNRYAMLSPLEVIEAYNQTGNLLYKRLDDQGNKTKIKIT